MKKQPAHFNFLYISYLAQGSLGRTTGSTEMNSVSSRSHAIFSVILKQHKSEKGEDGKTFIKTLNSKFHFVDLAGSERVSIFICLYVY